MNHLASLSLRLSSIFFVFVLSFGTLPVAAQDRTALDDDIHAAIKRLLETSPAAKELAKTAKGALVFPSIKKAGFIVGIQYGEGALIRKKQGGGYYIADYYHISSTSIGMQAGVKKFGYVMALMTDAAVENVETRKGFDLQFGPSIVLVNKGMAKQLSTETRKKDVYVFIFNQKGLMAGAGIQGTKITRLE